MMVVLNIWAKIIPGPLLLCDQIAEVNVMIQILAHVIVSVVFICERDSKRQEAIGVHRSQTLQTVCLGATTWENQGLTKYRFTWKRNQDDWKECTILW